MNQLGFTILLFIVIKSHANPIEHNELIREINNLDIQPNSEKGSVDNTRDVRSSGLTAGASFTINKPTDQDRARIEPTFKDYRAYDVLQNVLIKVFRPTPIVDTIQEHEKYGNDGSQHNAVGNAIVKGTETISRVINAVVDKPKAIIRSVSQGTTAALNQLGAKIIGL